MTDMILGGQGEQAADSAGSQAIFREFFLKQLEIDTKNASALGGLTTDDEFDPDGTNSKSGARASEFSKRSKSRKNTSRS